MKVMFATVKGSEAKMKYFTENWILPFVVLCALVAYAVLAIVFYNNDS